MCIWCRCHAYFMHIMLHACITSHILCITSCGTCYVTCVAMHVTLVVHILWPHYAPIIACADLGFFEIFKIVKIPIFGCFLVNFRLFLPILGSFSVILLNFSSFSANFTGFWVKKGLNFGCFFGKMKKIPFLARSYPTEQIDNRDEEMQYKVQNIHQWIDWHQVVKQKWPGTPWEP